MDRLRSDIDLQREIETSHARAAYRRSKDQLAHGDKYDEKDFEYWYYRSQSLASQVEADQHAYAAQVLAKVLADPNAVQSYSPAAHKGEPQHHPADGADGRDAHAS